jgi:ABC-type multidrug transport system fused ATPase/permease subunit
VQLIERLYEPTSGEILIDGIPLKYLNLRDFRRQIGYVNQEPVLLNTSIKNNILLGKPDATDEEISEALKKINAWDFVRKMPHGIEECTGFGGGSLSGGQK